MRGGVGSQRHIKGAHARCQKRLVRIAHGGIGYEQLFFLQYSLGDGLGALFIQQLFEAAFRDLALDIRRKGNGDLRLWQAILF